MPKHLFFTALVVVTIYLVLLFVIEHPFVTNVNTDPFINKNNAMKADSDSAHPESVSSAQHQQTMFVGPAIVGISQVINLSHAHDEIDAVWQQLFADNTLINAINWNQGIITAFVYYSEFSVDMSLAKLVIGFDERNLTLPYDKTPVVLPTGHYERFIIEPSSGIARDEAWTSAYLHKNLVERYKLNSHGEIVFTDAIVIKQ